MRRETEDSEDDGGLLGITRQGIEREFGEAGGGKANENTPICLEKEMI